MATQDDNKLKAALAALNEIEDNSIIGVGTGSTVNIFIEQLAAHKHRINGAVASSIATEEKLRSFDIPVVDINQGPMSVYIDGADECNNHCQLIKGGGGALTREKILAAVAKKFICIIDHSKRVTQLGDFPLPIEVIPLARSYVAREIVKLKGDPALREDFITDNGNQILDIHHLQIMQPIALEQTINNITGVVTNGIFSQRPADKVLIGTDHGVETLTPR